MTLVELLIVIGVIGVLVGSLVILINPAAQLRKTRDATRKSDLSQIRSALELYRSDIGNYPPEADITTGGVLNCSTAFTGGSPANTYMQRVPCDPLNAVPYKYYYDSPTVATYSLIACLEDTKDTQKDSSNNSAYCTGGTTNWSYTVINP